MNNNPPFIRRLRRALLPSRTLATYMAKMHITRFLGILIGLSAVLQLLDLLGTSDDIMAAHGATVGSLVTYVALRMPQLISQFAPFVALLATLLTLATLNQHSEVIIMKATGLSAHRILLPIGIASFLIATSHLAFNELVVVKANAELEYWSDNGFAVDLPPAPDTRGRIWLTEGNTLVLVGSVSRNRNRVVLDNVSLFERGEDGRLTAMVRADFAWNQDGKWTMHEVRRFNLESHVMEIHAQEDWGIKTPPERFMALTIRPDHVTFLKLRTSIKQLENEGLPTERLQASLLQKIAAPAATLLMPLLGAIAAFGVHRAGSLFMRLIGGMALGFSFFVADNFMLSIGEFGVVPPIIAAWAPFALFLLIGYAVLFNTEEGTIREKRKDAEPKAGNY